MKPLRTVTALVLIGSLTACASTPRGFVPVFAAPPEDQAAFDQAFQICSAEVAAGRRDDFRDGRVSSTTGGLAIGEGAALATGASAASGGGMLAGIAGGAGFAVGLVIFAPLAIFGLSRLERARKEREVTEAMSRCLAEEGFTVSEWRLARRGEMLPPLPPKRRL